MTSLCKRVSFLVAVALGLGIAAAHARAGDRIVRERQTIDQHQQTCDTLVAQGYTAIYVKGYNIGGQPLFDTVYERLDQQVAWEMRAALPVDQYIQKNSDLTAAGYTLICANPFTFGNQTCVSALWHRR